MRIIEHFVYANAVQQIFPELIGNRKLIRRILVLGSTNDYTKKIKVGTLS